MDFAPTDLDFIADPYPLYAELRGDEPVRYDDPITGSSRGAKTNALLRPAVRSTYDTSPATPRWVVPTHRNGTRRSGT
jgi:hypothetical protein